MHSLRGTEIYRERTVTLAGEPQAVEKVLVVVPLDAGSGPDALSVKLYATRYESAMVAFRVEDLAKILAFGLILIDVGARIAPPLPSLPG